MVSKQRHSFTDHNVRVIFEPLDSIARLAALDPKPPVSLTRYHGVFAPKSSLRAQATSGQLRNFEDWNQFWGNSLQFATLTESLWILVLRLMPMNEYRRPRILVTGGAGFLGSHLCERLLREGGEVLCVDNFYTGTRENVVHIIGNQHFEVLRHDITFPLYVEVDQIYNLACPASPIHYQFDPVQTTKTSVHGAINVLGLAKRVKAKIFQASTSEVYGDPEVHPQDETYWGRVNPTGARACYDEGKRCAETLFFDYYRQHTLPIKVGRIFNTYGPRMHPGDGRVISNFIVQGLKNDPITIYGDGNQTRSFCFVDDLIDAVVRFMASAEDFVGPVNLGNPAEITIRELAEKVIALIGSRSKLDFKSLPEDDPTQRCPDIRLAKQRLGWEPKVPLEEGLARTIKYFDELLTQR